MEGKKVKVLKLSFVFVVLKSYSQHSPNENYKATYAVCPNFYRKENTYCKNRFCCMLEDRVYQSKSVESTHS